MQSSRKLIELEALRGIAAIVVLIHHFMLGFTPRLHGLLYPDQPGSLFGTPAFAFVNGSAAVILFFVLSGFVLTVGLFRTESVWPGIVAAAKRWPRLAATVVIANFFAGALMAFGLFDNVHAAQFVPSIWLGRYYNWNSTGAAEIGSAVYEGATTFFSGTNRYNNVLWTMYYEFYGSMVVLGCAMLCARLPSPRLRPVVFVVFALSTFFIEPYLSPFIVGAWLASNHEQSPGTRWPNWAIVAAAPVILIVMGYHENIPSGLAEGWYAPLNPLIVLAPTHSLIAAHTAGSVLLLMLFLRVPAIKQPMSGTVGRRLGFLSFALYLVQVPVICSVSSWTYAALIGSTSEAVRIAITFCVTMAAAVLAAIPLAYFDRWWVNRLNAIVAALRIFAAGAWQPAVRKKIEQESKRAR